MTPVLRTPYLRSRERVAFAVAPPIVPFVYLLPFLSKTGLGESAMQGVT
jgi:hypothetical protein